jgi:hypothetical protein
MTTTFTDSSDQGAIEGHKVYTLNRFKEITQLGKHAIRQMRRRGLKVARSGGRAFILGSDFSDFLKAELERNERDEVTP